MNPGELKNRVTFYEYVPNPGPEPDDFKKNPLYKTWAKVDEVWLKDLELAKSTGTESDLTITIRDPRGFIPTNKHYISIDSPYYKGKKYNVKHVQPNLQDRRYIRVVAGLSE